MVELFVVVGHDVAAGEDVFQVLGEFGVDGHHVFEVAVFRAVLDHQNLAVAFDDGGFDLAYFLVHQNFVRQFAIENLLADFRHTLRAQRIGGAGPAEGWLRLLVGLEQRFVGPFRGGRRVLLDLIQTVEDGPNAFGGDGYCFFYVLDRLAHALEAPKFGLQASAIGLRPFGTLLYFRSWVFGLRKKLGQILALASPLIPHPQNLDHKPDCLWFSPGIEPGSYTFPWVLVCCDAIGGEGVTHLYPNEWGKIGV